MIWSDLFRRLAFAASNARPRRLSVSLAAMAVAAMGLAGCFESYQWHQKMSVTVQAPDGVKTGSSVIEVVKSRNTSGLALPDGGSAGTDVRGEAVVLEVAPGRYLFALLTGSDSIAQNTFPLGDLRGMEYRQWVTAIQNMTGVHRVPRERYPQLVTFANIDSPHTVRQVDPGNLAASFGPGYRLHSVTLEITDEPVTQGRVEEVLGWLVNDAALDEAWQPLNHDARTAVLGLRQPIRKNQ